MSTDNSWDDENVRGAQLYQQGRYAEAEQAFRSALDAAEHLGPDDVRVAVVLNNLASLCHNERKIEEAQALYERALAIRRRALGEHHPMVAQSLNNLSSLYRVSFVQTVCYTFKMCISRVVGTWVIDTDDIAIT